MGSLKNTKLNSYDLEIIGKKASELWIFGYGSILWKTGFIYKSKQVGKVRGFVRRFWQGNTTHRGTKEAPGRVATLVENPEGEVWGVAYELVGRKMIRKALHHLGMRECLLGGYAATMLPFESRIRGENSTDVLVFSATPENDLYMGPAPEANIASQVMNCIGASGHNIEYVLKLADYVRDHIPEETDKHLFQIDATIRTLLKADNAKPEQYFSSSLESGDHLGKHKYQDLIKVGYTSSNGKENKTPHLYHTSKDNIFPLAGPERGLPLLDVNTNHRANNA